jgi:hypothetical protein
MPELAWLSFLRGEWLLVTSDSVSDIRKWSDQHLALRDLENEGWIIAGASSRKLRTIRNPGRRLLGYCLKRTVH